MRTFDEIRLEYLRGNALRYQSSEAFFSEMYTKEELLSLLNSTGIELTERTLNYYVTVGLVDNPIIGPKRKGKGKEGYFPKYIYELIITIKKLQIEGYSLDDIKRKVFFENGDMAFFVQLDKHEHFIFFTKLSRLLIENLPMDSKEDDFLEYISLIPTESFFPVESRSVKHEKVFIELVKLLKIVHEKKELLFNHMIENGVANPELLFNSITDAIFKEKIETLFFKAPKEPSAIMEIASLLTVTTRIIVITSYFKAQLSTIKCLTNSFGAPIVTDEI